MEYCPDQWVGVKITGNSLPPIYKIFACWYGGYLSGDSWKLNSGITKVTLNENRYHFEGASGSVYICGEDNYGTSAYGSGILDNMIMRSGNLGTVIEILPENTNWLELKYE